MLDTERYVAVTRCLEPSISKLSVAWVGDIGLKGSEMCLRFHARPLAYAQQPVHSVLRQHPPLYWLWCRHRSRTQRSAGVRLLFKTPQCVLLRRLWQTEEKRRTFIQVYETTPSCLQAASRHAAQSSVQQLPYCSVVMVVLATTVCFRGGILIKSRRFCK